MSSAKQTIIYVAILANLIVGMSFSKPPINADFVNGLWARIGKRGGSGGYDINCNEPNKMDLKTFLDNCIENGKDGKQLFLKICFFLIH